MSYPLRTVAVVAALGVAGAAVWAFSGDNGDADGEPGTITLGRVENVALTTEHDCSDLLDYYRTEGARIVGPYGLSGGPMFGMERAVDAASDAAAGKVAAAPNVRTAIGGSQPITPDTGTNVQVAGVDESDIVKTSGDLMVAVVNGEVRITRLAGAATKTLSTWRLGEKAGLAQAVLLEGTTAVIISGGNEGGAEPAMKRLAGPAWANLVTSLTILDLADPAKPRPVRRLELGGNRSGEARLVDGELRLALTAQPHGITWKLPEMPNYSSPKDQAEAEAKFKRSEKEALAANKRLIAKSTIDNWIPTATSTALNAAGEPDGSVDRRPLLECEKVAVPGSFSGLGTLALVSVDLKGDAPLTTWRSAGVIADGSTLYATADHVWLATSRWDAVPMNAATSSMPRFAPTASTTQIHRFDTPLRGQPQYVASGQVVGSLLNQFAMDERDGRLRVASTTDGEAAAPANGPALPDDSSVSNGGSVETGPAGAAAEPGATAGTSEGSEGSSAGGGANSSSSSGDNGAGPDSVAPKGTEIPTPVTPATPVTPVPVTPATPLDPMTPGTPAPKEPGTPAPKNGQPTLSEGRITVLEVDGKELKQVGVVTGLGVGERIRGVRFVDDIGYVVTYRQTDPLYTVDLSDPRNPRVRGELAVLGYSAYLHPAGDGRLLGLGQDGTEEGRTTGLQLSLFDVSDLESPQRLDRVRLPEAWSDVEGDHHAFTMAGDLALIPYTQWASGETDPADASPKDGYRVRFDAGVIAVRVGADGIGKPTTLRPIAEGPVTFDKSGTSAKDQRLMEATPLRTVVKDGTIYTVTPTGIAAHTSTDFERLTYAKF